MRRWWRVVGGTTAGEWSIVAATELDGEKVQLLDAERLRFEVLPR